MAYLFKPASIRKDIEEGYVEAKEQGLIYVGFNAEKFFNRDENNEHGYVAFTVEEFSNLTGISPERLIEIQRNGVEVIEPNVVIGQEPETINEEKVEEVENAPVKEETLEFVPPEDAGTEVFDFKEAFNELSKENEALTKENQELFEDNTNLRIDIENLKTRIIELEEDDRE